MTSKIIISLQICLLIAICVFGIPPLVNMHNNNNKAELFLKHQRRMVDSMRVYVGDYPKLVFWRDSHDYYFQKVITHAGKTTK